MKKRVVLSYRGPRNIKLEEKLTDLLLSFGAVKAGEWGYNEGAFQCLCLFKEKQSLYLAYIQKLKQELGSDFYKINFFQG